MDTPKALIMWVGGAAGIMLIYSAIKAESPLTELRKWFGADSTTPVLDSVDTSTSADVQNEPVTTELTSYTVGTESGTSYVYDADGNPVSVVPSVYQSSPSTYIPSVTNE